MRMNYNSEGSIRGKARNIRDLIVHYICPCLNYKQMEKKQQNINHLEQTVSNTEQSHTVIPGINSRHNGMTTNFDNQLVEQRTVSSKIKAENTFKQKTVVQKGEEEMKEKNALSPIMIEWKDSEPNSINQHEIQKMQFEYEQYLRKTKQIKPHQTNTHKLHSREIGMCQGKERAIEDITRYQQNKLIVVGSQQSKLLCKIRSVYIEASSVSIQKQQCSKQKQQTVSNGSGLDKFWQKRYLLFERFDEGIKLDDESWYSVTPQAVAEYIATKINGFKCVLDAFAGAGGDSIQLALANEVVYSNDIDPVKLQLLANNAAVYAVDNIQPINEDFLHLTLPETRVDAVYMSPPWGGIDYFEHPIIKPQQMTPPLDLCIRKALTLSQNLVMLLPCNMEIESLASALSLGVREQSINVTCSVSIEKIFFQNRLKFLLVLFGRSVSGVNLGDELQYIYRMLGEGEESFKHKRVIKKVRQTLGLGEVLNLIFQCEAVRIKNTESIYEKFINVLIKREILASQQLQRLNELDLNDNEHRNKQKMKQQKTKVKEEKVRESNGGQWKVKQKNVNRVSLASEMQQTVSYASSVNESKLADSLKGQQLGNRETISGVIVQKFVE